MSSAAPEQQVQRQVVWAACFGTFLEWYDFLIFASLAVFFGQLFFPLEDAVAGLLASLATFGVGMLVRPLGAAIFGSLGDRIGRRKTFLATILLMGVSTLLMGCLPTYAQAGLWAPVGLLSLRLLQGLAVGGEVGGAAVYLTEHAPTGRRGRYTSVLQLMGPLGVLASGLQVLALQTFLTPDDFLAWGWRIPFGVSAALLAVSLRFRLQLHESPIFEALQAEQAVAKTPLRECWSDPKTRFRMFLLFACLSSGGSLLFFSSQVYAGVFLRTMPGVSPTSTGAVLTLITLCLLPMTVLAGAVSDRLGRRPVLLTGLCLGAVLMGPVFYGIQQVGGAPLPTFGFLLMLALALACITGPQTATLAELFPARTRYSAVALPHNLAAGWIGGLSPLVVTWLGAHYGTPLAGLAYVSGMLSIAAYLGWRYLPEVKDVDLRA